SSYVCSSRRRHTRVKCVWSSDVCSSHLCEHTKTHTHTHTHTHTGWCDSHSGHYGFTIITHSTSLILLSNPSLHICPPCRSRKIRPQSRSALYSGRRVCNGGGDACEVVWSR